MLKLKAGQMTGLKDRMVRALAGQQDSESSRLLFRGAVSSVEFSAKLPVFISRCQQENNGWKLMDPATEPAFDPAAPYAQVPGANAANTVRENTFDDPVIDVDAVVLARIAELTLEANNSFDALVAAVPVPGPNWTHGQQAQMTADHNAQRQIALLNINMKTDDIRLQTDTREANRKRRLKSFTECRQSVSKIINECVAEELLAPFRDTLTDHKYRFFYRSLCAAHDGSLGGTNTILAVINELNNYVYCHELSMDENLQYVGHLCHLAGYNDSYRLVTLLNAIDRSPYVHREIKNVASFHRHNSSDYARTSQALRTTYSNLLNDGLISQAPKRRDTAAAATASQCTCDCNICRATAAAAAAGGGDHEEAMINYGAGGGSKKRNWGGDPPDNGNDGPGRKRSVQKTGAKRHCNTCGKDGHTDEDCWQTHPCSTCGSTTHGDWNHDRVVAKEAKKTNSEGTLNLTEQFKRMNGSG